MVEGVRLTTLRMVRDRVSLAGQIFIIAKLGSYSMNVQITKGEARRLLSCLSLDAEPTELDLADFGHWYAAERRLYLGLSHISGVRSFRA